MPNSPPATVYTALHGSEKLVNRFTAKINKHANGCWEWAGNLLPNGYGAIQVNGRKESAHRLSYRIFIGHIPSGMYVCHHCDNKKCVKPDHLFVGSARDNAHDRAKKGRSAILVGERNPAAKLTDMDRARLVAEYINGSVPLNHLAKRYGISMSRIFKLTSKRRGRSGINNGRAKLTVKQVREIRLLIKNGESVAAVAHRYGVAWPQVKRIKTGEGWGHV